MVAVKVYGAVPPVAVYDAEYGTPNWPIGSMGGVTLIVTLGVVRSSNCETQRSEDGPALRGVRARNMMRLCLE
jgi:hypothetical protein